jgi:hypothetical protein
MTEARTPIATGGCQCGAVRYALYVAPQRSHVCHCRMCQRATGGLFAALAGAPKAAPLSFAYDRPDAFFYVTIGSLDDPEQAPVAHQFGLESKLSFVRFCEDLPQERTGEYSPDAAEFFATMVSRQA